MKTKKLEFFYSDWKERKKKWVNNNFVLKRHIKKLLERKSHKLLPSIMITYWFIPTSFYCRIFQQTFKQFLFISTRIHSFMINGCQNQSPVLCWYREEGEKCCYSAVVPANHNGWFLWQIVLKYESQEQNTCCESTVWWWGKHFFSLTFRCGIMEWTVIDRILFIIFR